MLQFSALLRFHSECDQDAAATGRIAACSVRAVKPDAVAQEFHARRFLENDVLKHFGIATVEQQRDAVAVFRQLSDKLFDKGTRVRRIEPYTPFPFQGQSVHVPVIHDLGGRAQRMDRGARVKVEPA